MGIKRLLGDKRNDFRRGYVPASLATKVWTRCSALLSTRVYKAERNGQRQPESCDNDEVPKLHVKMAEKDVSEKMEVQRLCDST